ncbi:MAG TPA: hypothetical protein VHT96_13955 [Clostridia bacterium]|nr:hypothetical protein [Clostridia bacterium]
MLIDTKIGDVNGDMVLDIVYLTGDLYQGNPYYQNIKLIIEDGKTKYRYTVPLPPPYTTGADPWIFLGGFTSNRVQDIFVSLPLNNRNVYYIVTFLHNQPNFILMPDKYPVDYDTLSKELDFSVVYKDFYKVDITSPTLNQTITLDVSDRKQEYEGVIYNKDGTLIKPFNGFLLYSPFLFPVKMYGNEPLKLMAMDDIAGTSHVDKLGELVYYFKYSAAQQMWSLDPKQAQVLIQ